jgi:dihydroflavonol-4-reductase
MKVFVTGGTGFIGSHLVAALLHRGDEVICLARDPGKVDRVFSGAARPRIVLGDVATRDALLEGVRGADCVFHVSGITAGRSESEFFRVNAGGTRLVAEAAAAAAPGLNRFVQVSSLAAAGPARRGVPLAEAATARPITAYGRSKLAGEEVLANFSFPWTIVRPAAVYGPRDTEMYRLFRLAKFGITAVFGSGAQELSLIFVDDLVSALLHAAETSASRKIYFAAHPEVTTSHELVIGVHRAVRSLRPSQPFQELAPFILPIPGPIARAGLWLTELAAGLAGRATLLTADKANEFLAEAWLCSPAALRRDTGWQPKWNLANGLARTAAWYREAGWL